MIREVVVMDRRRIGEIQTEEIDRLMMIRQEDCPHSSWWVIIKHSAVLVAEA
jgi:hypothetical protein